MEISQALPNIKFVWWMVLVRGIAAIAFGILAMFWTSTTLTLLFLYFGLYLLIDGVISVVSGIVSQQSQWGWLAALGLVEIVVGVLVLRNPDTTAKLLVIFLALWALVGGALQLLAAWRFRAAEDGSWVWLMVAGVLSAVFGIYFIINPAGLANFLLVVTGAFSVILGVILVAGALRLRKAVTSGEFVISGDAS